jgi:ABC-type branched-subunit amino acid transport system substrate-binding protein
MVRTRWGIRLFAVFAALALLGAACGDDDDDAGEATTTVAAEESDCAEGTLQCLKGTTPLTELSQDFQDRMLEIDPSLQDFNYGAESYDAVVVIALAANIAGDDGSAHAAEIVNVTRDGEQCDSFESCMALVSAGTTDIDYDGVSGPLDFSANGEPTVASYAILEFGENNELDDSLTEYRQAQAPADIDETFAPDCCPVEVQRAGDGVLRIGSLLPETGDLAFLGPPEFAGVDLAIQDVNAAGGFNGTPLEHIRGDSGDSDPDVANPTVDSLLAQNVDAIIGAAASGITLNVIDKITAAGVTQFSPANTSKQLSDYPDRGLYFRNAPSDILQGQVLGELIAEDGNSTLAIINRDDSYGNGLAEDLAASFEAAGGEVVQTITYDPEAPSFDAEVQELAGLDADAIAIITFEEGSRILARMVELGIGPDTVGVYGCDGNMGNALGADFAAGE